MAYEIRDYSHRPGWVEYVSDMTTSIADAYTTAVPLDKKEKSRFSSATPPKQFKTKSEAKPYLDALKAARNAHWQENKWHEVNKGRFKPQFKIYISDSSLLLRLQPTNAS